MEWLVAVVEMLLGRRPGPRLKQPMSAAAEGRGKRGWFEATAAVGRRRNLSYPAGAGVVWSCSISDAVLFLTILIPPEEIIETAAALLFDGVGSGLTEMVLEVVLVVLLGLKSASVAALLVTNNKARDSMWKMKQKEKRGGVFCLVGLHRGRSGREFAGVAFICFLTRREDPRS